MGKTSLQNTEDTRQSKNAQDEQEQEKKDSQVIFAVLIIFGLLVERS
jgi:hypothetical protein